MAKPEIIEVKGKRYVMVHGQAFPEALPPWMIQLWCWANYQKLVDRGTAEVSRYIHLKQGICMVDEQMRTGWNDWTETMCWAYGNYSYFTAMGCTSSTKTHTFHKLGMYDFISSYTNTTMTCTTTNSAGLEQRMWPIISGTFNMLKKTGAFPDWRTVVAPQRLLRTSPSETKHVIRAVTIEEKAEEQAVIDQLIGVHCERRIWLVDEATSAPTCLDSAWANASAATTHRRFGKLGNPFDQADALAVSARPITGWDSLDENTEKWEYEFYGEKGIGLHFHGQKSPNIKRGLTAAGKERWPFMYGHEDLARHKTIQFTDPITFARMCIGWFAAEGISMRVCSWVKVDRHKVKEHALFQGGDIELFASLDPAFGGDRATLYIWKKGYCLTKRKVVMDRFADFEIPIDPKGLPGEQIGKFVQEKQKQFHFSTIGIDTTTNNSAAAEWIETHMFIKVIWVEFGGKASDRPVSDSDDRLCKDLYYNFASELQFSVDQHMDILCGLDQQACIELCSRFYEEIGNKPTRKKVESKVDFRSRMKKSPDRGDAVAIGVEVFRQIGGSKTKTNENKSKGWNQVMKKKNALMVSNYGTN